MEFVTIYADRFEEAQKLASKHNVVLEVRSERKLKNLSGKFSKCYTVSVKAVQSEDVPTILAYADKDGMVTTFTEDYNITKEQYEELDFSHCDRCGLAKNRRKVFIINDHGTIKQVGGSCAKELNCETRVKRLLKAVNKFLQAFNEVDDLGYYEGGSGRRVFSELEINSILILAAGLTKLFGYVSTNTQYMNPDLSTTREDVEFLLAKVSGEAKKRQKELRERVLNALTEEEKEYGYWISRCEEWLENQEWSEFHQSALNSIRIGSIKLLGVLVCLPNLIIREEEKKRQQEAWDKRKEHFIKPIQGEKIEINGEVVKVKEDDGFYGTSVRITLIDDQFGKIWFQTTAKFAWSLKAGDRITGNLTIKEVLDEISFGKRPSKIEVHEAA